MFNIRNGIYKYIGDGSSREVYDLNNGYVLKVAKNSAGLAQNKSEYKIYKKDNSRLFADIVYVSDDYNFVIMRKAKRVHDILEVWDYFNVSSKFEFYNLNFIRRMKFKYNLVLADLNRPSSWGIIDKRYVIIDYGFTNEVKDKHY